MQKLFNMPFLGRGFRPFFFFGALYSVISIFVWSKFYTAPTAQTMPMDPFSWHTHEMLFGFTIAIIAGFLLTAVANWTGSAPLRQGRLAGLVLLWIAGRIVMSIDFGLPQWLIFTIAGSFIPMLAIALAAPLIKKWNKRNFVFIVLLATLSTCEIWSLTTYDKTPLYIALMVIMALVSLIGGRIIPAFTVAALKRNGINAAQTPQPKTDIAALLSLVAVMLCFVFAENSATLTMAAVISGLIHLARLRHYHTLKTLHDPLLWVLHLGYIWLIIGLFMLAFMDTMAVIHTFTVGCIGSMTLGMMCRVSLGHTGRDLIASPLTIAIFGLIQVAAIIRIFGPILIPDYKIEWVTYSAMLWNLCFALYLIGYSYILFSPRPDKQMP